MTAVHFDDWTRTTLDLIEGQARAAEGSGAWPAAPDIARRSPDLPHVVAQFVATWSPSLVVEVIDSVHGVLAEHMRAVDDTCTRCAGGAYPVAYPCQTVRAATGWLGRFPGYHPEWGP